MENKNIKILAIDDNRDNLISLKAIISEVLPQSVVYVELSGQGGIESARKNDPDVILLDIVMPGMDGYQVCKILKADEQLSETPIIFLTALKGDKQSRILALEAGGEAFLAKPIDAIELKAQILAMLKIKEAAMYNRNQRLHLEELVQKRTEELKIANIAALNLLEDLKTENEIRKQSEEGLKESEVKYRYMFENNPQPMWIYDLETLSFLEVNNAAINHYGYSREEFLSMTLKDIRPKEDIEALLHDVEKTRKSYNPAGQWRHLKKNGELIFVEIISHSITFNNRKARHVIVNDITEQKQAEENLKNSKKLLAETELIGKVGGWEFNIDTLETTWTEEVYRIHEVDFDFYHNVNKGINFHTLESRPIIERAVKRIIEFGEPFDLELEIITAKGNLKTVHTIGKPDIENHRVYGFFQDITERKQTEEKLKLLNRAVEASSVAVEITDAEGNINYVNPYFSELTGYSDEEVLGKNPRFLKSGNHPKTFYEELWNTILSGKDWTGEFQNKKKNGELYWEKAIISPILNSNGKVASFVAIKDDITERKKILEELVEAKEKAEESDRLKTAFLANMSHEIRTPMNGILGFAGLLKDSKLSGELQQKYIEIIEKSGTRMLNIINDIVSISKIESGIIDIHLSETNINDQLQFVYDVLKLDADNKKLNL